LPARIESWSRRRFCAWKVSVLVRRFGLRAARRFGTFAAFGFLHLIHFGTAQSTLGARQAATATSQLRHNKTLHPTAASLRSCLAPASGGG